MPKARTPWAKSVQRAMIDQDVTVAMMADDLGLTRQYVSSVAAGRYISPAAQKKISDYLKIPYPDDMASHSMGTV